MAAKPVDAEMGDSSWWGSLQLAVSAPPMASTYASLSLWSEESLVETAIVSCHCIAVPDDRSLIPCTLWFGSVFALNGVMGEMSAGTPNRQSKSRSISCVHLLPKHEQYLYSLAVAYDKRGLCASCLLYVRQSPAVSVAEARFAVEAQQAKHKAARRLLKALEDENRALRQKEAEGQVR